MRKDVAFACEQFQVSERRACKLLGMDREMHLSAGLPTTIRRQNH